MGNNKLYDVPGTHREQIHVEAVAAGTATQEIAVWKAPDDITVTGVSFLPSAAATGNDTNKKNLNLRNKGTDGSGTTAIANLDLDTDEDLTAYDEKAFTLSATAANLDLDEGEIVGLQHEQAGSGIAIPEGTLVIEFEAR